MTSKEPTLKDILRQVNQVNEGVIDLAHDTKDRVEGVRDEVSGVRGDLGGLKSDVHDVRDDVRELGAKLDRIETQILGDHARRIALLEEKVQ